MDSTLTSALPMSSKEADADVALVDRYLAGDMPAFGKFFASADPHLTVRQRARMRVFMVNMENQINQLIRLSQSPNPPPGR